MTLTKIAHGLNVPVGILFFLAAEREELGGMNRDLPDFFRSRRRSPTGRDRPSADIGRCPRRNAPMSAMQRISVILELADLVKAWADAFSRGRRNPHTCRHGFQNAQVRGIEVSVSANKAVSCHKRRIVGSKLAGVLQHFVVWRPHLNSLPRNKGRPRSSALRDYAHIAVALQTI
ncbi:hypothetical protein [Caballeronia udeis]|uniref:hypothetical protein n=1 Tax=Caballeronia udeis TaxID=1232866 RepID=UPI0018D34776|nr:hypothetical protein [Caballeronia udeis]